MKISRLTLYTRFPEEQKKFYGKTLGLKPVSDSPDAFSLSIGHTLLTFVKNPAATPYHFAINIPPFSEVQALEWLKERSGILTDHGREIQDFTAWNARSVYFYDADRNIVEFIARRNLTHPQAGNFGPLSLMGVSEIGLAVQHIGPCYQLLKATAGLELFDGDLKQFSAIGDDHGLFICVNIHRKSWYPTGDTAYPSEFETHISENQREFHITYYQQDLQIKVL